MGITWILHSAINHCIQKLAGSGCQILGPWSLVSTTNCNCMWVKINSGVLRTLWLDHAIQCSTVIALHNVHAIFKWFTVTYYNTTISLTKFHKYRLLLAYLWLCAPLRLYRQDTHWGSLNTRTLQYFTLRLYCIHNRFLTIEVKPLCIFSIVSIIVLFWLSLLQIFLKIPFQLLLICVFNRVRPFLCFVIYIICFPSIKTRLNRLSCSLSPKQFVVTQI